MANDDKRHGLVLAVMAGVFGLLGVGAGSAISYIGLERQLDAESSATVRSDRRAAYERFLELSALSGNLEMDYYDSLVQSESHDAPPHRSTRM